MSLEKKILISAGLLLTDLVIFFLPIGTTILLVVLWAKPIWFRDLVLELYSSDE